MTDIFVAIPSYADPDLARTIESVIRSSSGQHSVHISVAEQVTRYAEAYALDRRLDEHVSLDVAFVGAPHLLGLCGARNLAETRYAGEDIQLQVDSHARFESDWDIAVTALLEKAGQDAVISSYRSNPWAYPGRVPVCRFDRIEGSIPRGHIDMVEPESGRPDQLYPARTVLGGAVVGTAWCAEVPADPHILFSGEEPALAARLWTHGRTLWHGCLPWYQADAGGERPGTQRAFHHPDWPVREEQGLRRVEALLGGTVLEDGDPVGEELAQYGLGSVATLDDWIQYSGIDYRAGTVRTPWP